MGLGPRPRPFETLGSLDGDDQQDTFENREAFVRWLTRPPSEYSSDEGFNLFLVAFHGYCLYDAIRRGDFEGFSFFSFLPVLAVIVMLQIVAKLRANARGYVAVGGPVFTNPTLQQTSTPP